MRLTINSHNNQMKYVYWSLSNAHIKERGDSPSVTITRARTMNELSLRNHELIKKLHTNHFYVAWLEHRV